MNPRIIDKTTIIKDSLSAASAGKPVVFRIPHIQTKSPLNVESGKVVIVKTTGNTNVPNISPIVQTPSNVAVASSGTKPFSVLKLSNGQLLLMPTGTTQSQQPLIVNENGISRIIKAPSTSPPNPTTVISTIKQVTKEPSTPRVNTIHITNLSSSSTNIKSTSPSITPPERRLRPIAPAPNALTSATNELLSSLSVQHQDQLSSVTDDENLLRFDPASILLGEDDALSMICETVTLDSTGSSMRTPSTKTRLDSLPIEQKTSLPVVSSTSLSAPIEQKTKTVRKSTTTASSEEKAHTTKARLENKATSIIKDARKKMTPRQTPTVPPSSAVKTTVETKLPKTPIKRPNVTPVPTKIDPEEGIRMKICETILRSLIGKIEREQNQESIKNRLEKHSTTLPKHEHRQIILTRLLNERVDHLRQEFLKNRSDRKTALVKEQFEVQRLKQQQQMILKQQQQLNAAKREVTTSEDEHMSMSPIKKVKRFDDQEIKLKRSTTPKSSELKIKNSSLKRTRPLSISLSESTSKKVRHSRDPTDNDENRKLSSKYKSKLSITLNQTIQRKGNKFSADFHPDNLDCTCRNNDDVQEKFFIQCELCSRWLHGKCVGLTARAAERVKEFICQDCTVLTQRAKERLYCICQRPYDDSRFYIGCDVCADWLHGSCVNITPEDAEKFEVYVCPRCSTEKKQEFLNKPITGETRKRLLHLIDQLLSHKMSWPFQKPVDVKDVPNYYKIIKDPMDLTTLKSKVTSHKFRTICDFIRDVNKIFNNCRQFNAIDSAFSQCANVVDNVFRQLLENLMVKDQ